MEQSSLIDTKNYQKEKEMALSQLQDVENTRSLRRVITVLMKSCGDFAILGFLCLGGVGGCKSHKQAAAIHTKPSRPIPLHAETRPVFQITKSVVASAGAVLETTDGEGTQYRLTLPPGALPADATITLTPLASIQGMPGQTRAYGVDIGPAGTLLKQFAHLEISPRQPLPTHGLFWLETRGLPS
jgi:hypothetical protein